MELPDYVYNPAAPSIYAICQIITKNFLFVNIFLEYFEKLSKSNLGEPPAGGRGNAPLELAGWWQSASSSNPRGSAKHFRTDAPTGWRCESAFIYFLIEKVNKSLHRLARAVPGTTNL